MSLRACVAKQSPVKWTRPIELFFSQNTEIAHLHCTERSAAQVSTGERRLAMK